MKSKILILGILFIGIFACSNDDDSTDQYCTDTTLNTTSLETEYDCINTSYQMEIDLSEEYTIIRNQTGFDALVSGTCQPAIDFSTYDLIIGKKGLSSGNTSIEYELIEDCETGNVMLTITFNQNETAEAPNLTYHALFPKLGDEQELNVEIVVVD